MIGTTIISRCFGILQIVELAGPEDLVAVRQLDRLGDALLGLGDRAAEVAAADAELDRNVALAALAVDEGSAGIERDIRQFAQRNVGVGARRASDRPTLTVRIASMLLRYLGSSLTAKANCRSPSSTVVAVVPPDRRLHHRVDVAGVEAVARGLFAVDLDVEIGLAQHMENAEVGDALDLAHLGHHLGRERFQRLQVRPDDLDRIGALHARQRLLDVVLDILREVEPDARQFLGELLLQLFRQLFLGQVRRPFVEWLERREQFDVGERRGVAAIVGTAVLRHHGDDLRMAQQDLPHLARRLGAGIERDRRRHRRPDPEIALLQRRQEFAAEPRGGQHAQRRERRRRR